MLHEVLYTRCVSLFLGVTVRRVVIITSIIMITVLSPGRRDVDNELELDSYENKLPKAQYAIS